MCFQGCFQVMHQLSVYQPLICQLYSGLIAGTIAWLKSCLDPATSDMLVLLACSLWQVLNELEGVSCTSIDGALYAFPTITLPEGAFKKAKEIGKTGEWLYCKEMLENTGIVIVPGNGFGQKDGTHHFRTTILPGEDQIESVCDRMRNYHKEFLSKYKNWAWCISYS